MLINHAWIEILRRGFHSFVWRSKIIIFLFFSNYTVLPNIYLSQKYLSSKNPPISKNNFEFFSEFLSKFSNFFNLQFLLLIFFFFLNKQYNTTIFFKIFPLSNFSEILSRKIYYSLWKIFFPSQDFTDWKKIACLPVIITNNRRNTFPLFGQPLFQRRTQPLSLFTWQEEERVVPRGSRGNW